MFINKNFMKSIKSGGYNMRGAGGRGRSVGVGCLLSRLMRMPKFAGSSILRLLWLDALVPQSGSFISVATTWPGPSCVLRSPLALRLAEKWHRRT